MIGAEQENLAKLGLVGPLEQEEQELARAGIYRLLAFLLGAPPNEDGLHQISGLGEGSSPIDDILANIAADAKKADPAKVAREYHNLFVGLGEGELVPYGSYYLAGFLNERPLARLRSDLRRLKIEQEAIISEPEDSISSICEVMSALVAGEINGSVSLKVQRDFFAAHVGSWAGDFFADLEKANSSHFYGPVGSLGVLFMNIEKQAFEIDE